MGNFHRVYCAVMPSLSLSVFPFLFKSDLFCFEFLGVLVLMDSVDSPIISAVNELSRDRTDSVDSDVILRPGRSPRDFIQTLGCRLSGGVSSCVPTIDEKLDCPMFLLF